MKKQGSKVDLETCSAHGGARQGAGRPATGHQRYNFTLNPELVEQVRQLARNKGTTMSGLVALALREWLKRNS